LRLLALGREAVQLDQRVLGPADFSYAKPRELLFFLAEAGPSDKGQIGLALWPVASPGELRSAFHTTLHHLRRAVGSGRVLFEQGGYRLDGDRLDYDVTTYRQALAAARQAPSRGEELARLQHATGLYPGDFLAASAPGWSERTRDELRERQQRALLALGRMLLARGGHLAALDVFRRVLSLDELNEPAHRELMRCYQAMGEPSRASRQYEKLAVLLREEVGALPSGSTVELYDRIRAG
jgi:two-component SAPR family response regulator